MNELVTIEKGEIFTTAKQIADGFNDGDKNVHTTIVTAINNMLSQYDTDGLVLWSGVDQTIEKNTKRLNKPILSATIDQTATIEPTEHTISNGNTYKTYKLNRDATMLLLMRMGKYRNARKAQLEFIKAFNTLEQQCNNTKVLQEVEQTKPVSGGNKELDDLLNNLFSPFF